jgi:Protein of unknown function (DUF2442)
MYYDVVSAEYLKDYILKIWFADGKLGIVDFTPYIRKGGVFSKLAELKNFKSFLVNQELGIITWHGENRHRSRNSL